MNEIISRENINEVLRNARAIAQQNDLAISGVIEKINKRIKLSDLDVGILLFAPPKYSQRIFEEAALINNQLHNNEIRFYGVIYISDFCVETCSYCGDSLLSARKETQKKIKRFLNRSEFIDDVKALIEKYPDLKEICILSGDSPSLTVEKWIDYIQILNNYFKGKIILNKEPFNYQEFVKVRKEFPDVTLQFRVFQETYDQIVYEKEHRYYGEVFNNDASKKKYLMRKKLLYPIKTNYDFRLFSQERAILAGFDEYGLGVLLGLNYGEFKSAFEVLALKRHADYLYAKYGLWPATISFPRILPSVGVNYDVPGYVSDENYIRILSVTKLAIPYSKLINTCRETAEIRRKVRPIISIEDFEARPGPGGNSINNFICQMEITDKRSGKEILNEIKEDGFTIY